MKAFMKITLVLLYLLLGFSACKDDDESPEEMEQLHECVDYDPTQSMADLSGTWENSLDEDEYTFTVPSDPGGGYVEVMHTSPAPIVPTMFSNVNPPVGGTISGGSAGQSDNEQVRHDVFEVAAGQSYQVLVDQFFKASTDDYPLNYTGSMVFHGRVDCYEPNDSFDQARAIPTDLLIEAFGIAGYKDSFVRTSDPHTLDWYKFTLNSPAEIEIEFIQVASNQQVNLLMENGLQQLIFSVSAAEGELLIHNAGTLEAGTWYLRVHPIPDHRAANLLNGQSIPDHFDTPYKFRVNIK